jgi:hypothetical protein
MSFRVAASGPKYSRESSSQAAVRTPAKSEGLTRLSMHKAQGASKLKLRRFPEFNYGVFLVYLRKKNALSTASQHEATAELW